MKIQELKEIVDKILVQFQREELGNRVTNFSSAALRYFILEEFGKAISEEEVPTDEEGKNG